MQNRAVIKFLDEIYKLNLSEKIMKRKERMELLSKFARGNLSNLVDFNHYEIEDFEGKKQKQSCWSFKDSDNLNPDDICIISELSTSASGLKIKIQDRTASIKELNEMDKNPELDDEISDVTITDVINDITSTAKS